MNIRKTDFFRLWGLRGLIAFLMLISLAGCGKNGKPDEGNCECVISLVDLPKEFSMLEDNIRNNFEVRVTLKNITSEKLYHVTLVEKEDFTKELHLHPGIYQVYGAVSSQSSNTGITLAADAESIELKEDSPASICIRIANPEEFTSHWMSIQPMPEIRLAEKFDGLVQINRQVFDLRAEDNSALFDALELKYDKEVRAYEKIEISNPEKGITLTLQNQKEDSADWRDCRVIGIYVTKNNVVFPHGVTLGMAPAAVCHEETGLYGAPDKLTGSLLFGWHLDDTCAVYNDPSSGDKLTLNLGTDGDEIRSIRYELALFEE